MAFQPFDRNRTNNNDPIADDGRNDDSFGAATLAGLTASNLSAAGAVRLGNEANLFGGISTDDVLRVGTAGADAFDGTQFFRFTLSPDAGQVLNLESITVQAGCGGADQAHQSAYETTIRDLLDQVAPIHGIGMQGHFGQTLTPPAQLLKVLDRYADTGLRIKVTEFDISMDDEAMQGAYDRDFLTTMYSHPSVDAVVMWGFWENRHWRSNAAWWRADWSPRPAVQAIRSLLEDAWWTRGQGATGHAGQWSVQGHLGDYRLVITTAEGRQIERRATHDLAGTEVLITLE